jgi:ribonucrease Y
MQITQLLLGAVFWWALLWTIIYLWENIRSNKARSKSEIIVDEAYQKKDTLLLQAKKDAEDMIRTSKMEAEETLKNAKNEAETALREAKSESAAIMEKSQKIEEKILEREEKIQTRLEEIEKKQESIYQKEEELKQKREILIKKEEELDGKISEIAKLTESQAKELFIAQIGEKYSQDGLTVIEKYKSKIEDQKKEIAREIILKSIQQFAGDVTNEVTTTIIELPSDDIKWKLIWKEGRNITTFEKATGVALIIDDTPDSVFISAFDLFRRYVAKKSLEKLIEDGRIQPARIEEIVAKTYEEADVLLKELGQKTVEELGIADIPADILPIIWKMRFRTSYGQNILKHSKEVAYIAEALARELGADPELVKRGGLLHDIGKALDHDVEGTHPEIGGKLARKYKLHDKIIDMIENHHGEPYSLSLETAIVQVADAISSVRPGARREVIEQYLKRVQEMEALVQSFTGVSKAYALSAGREVRVFVDADTISDIQAQETARNIATEIQEKMSYPGEVKVSLIREMRVIEYAK